ncbi:MAG TPA: sigma-54 dependent transcriptional regulator [Phycisphaerae bacterium]|nr:sigma-54 dependent transcriptional regulator [Phycisphaerae bacterium]
MARILIVEDEPILRQNIADRLRAEGHEVVDTGTGEAGVELATLLAPDLVLTDLRLPGMDGLRVLRDVKRINPRTMVVMLTAHGSEKSAVDALREGAYDYLHKPVDLKELALLIERAVSHCRALDGLEYLRETERQKGTLAALIGVSANIRDVKNLVRQLASSPAVGLQDPPTVLITGETGCGKDLIAHAIHYEGPRKNGPFVHVNCTAISETLFESELFGHVKGSFTDARTNKKGLFQVAEGGTIFLDEIGHMGPAMQAKLLLALEKRTIRPIGATDERLINVHIIAATNRDLQEAINKNDFRPDLFHRLRVFEIHVLPLRQRPEDILPIAETFTKKHAKRFSKPTPVLSSAASAALKRFHWPGNVRELSHTLESAILTCDETELSEKHLRLDALSIPSAGQFKSPGRFVMEMDFEGGTPTLEQAEQQIIRAAFEYSGRNLRKTARILGLSREAIRYRLAKAEVKPAAE